MSRSNPLRAAIVAAALAALASPAVAGDIVRRKDGSHFPQQPAGVTEPGPAEHGKSTLTLVDADDQKVTYRMEGVPQAQSFKSADLDELLFDPASLPPSWKQAQADLDGRDFENAMKRFLALGSDRGVNKVLQQKAFRNAVAAAAGAGNLDWIRSAVAAMDKAFPQSFYRRHSREILLQAYIDAGDGESALTVATELEGMAGLGDADKVKIALLRARVAYRKAVAADDKAAIRKSLEDFQRLATQSAGRPGMAKVNLVARAGGAQANLALGETAAARAEFEAILRAMQENASLADNSVYAAAWAGLGDIWFRQGDRAGWMEARRCFLRVTCLYADGSSADDLARALYYTGACFYKLQDTPDWWANGTKELQECQQRFGRTHWGQQAATLRQQTPRPK